jgi:ADP-ribose pyrophosphatase YjhB (NUDIX family)
VHVGGTLVEAFRREVLEVTDLEVEMPGRVICDCNLKNQYHYILVYFFCDARTITLALRFAKIERGSTSSSFKLPNTPSSPSAGSRGIYIRTEHLLFGAVCLPLDF